MTYDVLIGVHGYTKCKYGKIEETVIIDRLNGALEAATKYKEIGAKIGIVYLGDDSIQNKTTISIAKNNNHKLISKFDTIIKNNGTNTKEEINTFIKYANKIQPTLIVSVSSKDHTPRIMRELTNFQTKVNYGLTVYASDENYTINELSPFILEGTYPNCIESLNNIFSINNKHKKNLAQDIEKEINKYK